MLAMFRQGTQHSCLEGETFMVDYDGGKCYTEEHRELWEQGWRPQGLLAQPEQASG